MDETTQDQLVSLLASLYKTNPTNRLNEQATISPSNGIASFEELQVAYSLIHLHRQAPPRKPQTNSYDPSEETDTNSVIAARTARSDAERVAAAALLHSEPMTRQRAHAPHRQPRYHSSNGTVALTNGSTSHAAANGTRSPVNPILASAQAIRVSVSGTKLTFKTGTNTARQRPDSGSGSGSGSCSSAGNGSRRVSGRKRRRTVRAMEYAAAINGNGYGNGNGNGAHSLPVPRIVVNGTNGTVIDDAANNDEAMDINSPLHAGQGGKRRCRRKRSVSK